MKKNLYKTVSKCSLQFAIEEINQSIPTELVEVDRLPNEFYQEDFYGESQYRSMDGDCCTHFPEKGIAVLQRRSMSTNRAEGSVARHEIIYYKKGFVVDVQVLESVEVVPQYTIVFDYKREGSYYSSIPEQLFVRLIKHLFWCGIEVTTSREDFHRVSFTICGESKINQWLKYQPDYADYIKATYLD